jgi:hypothetical protein
MSLSPLVVISERGKYQQSFNYSDLYVCNYVYDIDIT